MRLPDLELLATDGTLVNPAKVKGRAVWVIYPYTGQPGVPDPKGWDHILGAHGSTPQLQAYSLSYKTFRKHDMKLFGVSGQESLWQQEFVARCRLSYPLLSDVGRHFATAMGLERFSAGATEFLQRRTIISRDGVVVHDRTRIADPANDAVEVLAWLETP